jgi:hypothetical protein
MNIIAQLEALSARQVEEAEPAFANELDYLEYVWRDPTEPDCLRIWPRRHASISTTRR